MEFLHDVEENSLALLNYHQPSQRRSNPKTYLLPQAAPRLGIATIQLRRGTEADAEFFFEMEEQTTWESLPPDKVGTVSREQLRRSLRQTHQSMLRCPSNVCFIAEAVDGGCRERVGLLWFGLRRNLLTSEDEAWIYNVTTVAAWRGRGIARQMMEHTEEHARGQGHDVIGLCVAVHNEIARDCYARLDYYPSNIIMRKVLTRKDDTEHIQRRQPDSFNTYCGGDVLLK
ncbi:MAG TPA: GNAT family N-acetyltransferase [Abditibacteriaceae bacterium]|jgi:ribosomal protein S18 acetylase RimI-like enzyme